MVPYVPQSPNTKKMEALLESTAKNAELRKKRNSGHSGEADNVVGK